MRKSFTPPEGIPEKIIVTDILDLHGFFPEQIPEVMDEFLKNAVRLNIKQVRIIHGKGKSRLKYEVHQILKQDKRVALFSDTLPGSGGWGATLADLII